MITPPAAESPSAPRTTAQLVDRLVAVLDTESRLLSSLLEVIRRQRHAVAHENVEELESANGAAHRILTTLGEARHHRQTLNARLGESDDLRLGAIAEWFGGVLPTALDAAIRQLSDAARQLDAELRINEQVFRAVSASADRQVRLLLGASEVSPSGYAPRPDGQMARSVLVDWRG